MDKVRAIEGVILTPNKIIVNPKGNIFHAMKQSDGGFNGFGEAYFSTVLHAHTKAWKKHSRMTLNLLVPVGEVRFVIYDNRESSISFGQYMDISLSKRNYQRLTIPPNVWFGFQGIGKDLNLLLNLADIEHDPAEQVNIDINEIKYKW